MATKKRSVVDSQKARVQAEADSMVRGWYAKDKRRIDKDYTYSAFRSKGVNPVASAALAYHPVRAYVKTEARLKAAMANLKKAWAATKRKVGAAIIRVAGKGRLGALGARIAASGVKGSGRAYNRTTGPSVSPRIQYSKESKGLRPARKSKTTPKSK